MTVPCNKCLNCMQRRRAHWSFRLHQELKVSKSAKFITLTYADDYLPTTLDGEITIEKKAIQGFLKKLRREEKKINDNKIKYFATGEYGSRTDRPHYHLIIFNLTIDKFTEQRIQHAWSEFKDKKHIPFGYVDVGTVNAASIHYITKYLTDNNYRFDANYTRQKPFNLMSKNLGIDYLKKNEKMHKNSKTFYAVMHGHRVDLPRYYKDQIFDEDERRENAVKMSELAEQQFNKQVQHFGYDETYMQRDRFMQTQIEIQKQKNKKCKL